MEDLRQLVFTQRRNQNMHVVGRDGKLVKRFTTDQEFTYQDVAKVVEPLLMAK